MAGITDNTSSATLGADPRIGHNRHGLLNTRNCEFGPIQSRFPVRPGQGHPRIDGRGNRAALGSHSGDRRIWDASK